MSSSLKIDLEKDFAAVCIRVYRLEIQSVNLVFSPSFVNCCSSNLLFGSPPPTPPLSCVKKYYIQTVSGWEGMGVAESC
jgi:hypothetical protein